MTCSTVESFPNSPSVVTRLIIPSIQENQQYFQACIIYEYFALEYMGVQVP